MSSNNKYGIGKIDVYILGKFQKFSNFCQTNFGYTCYMLCDISLILWVIVGIINIVFAWQQKDWLTFAMLTVLMPLAYWFVKRHIFMTTRSSISNPTLKSLGESIYEPIRQALLILFPIFLWKIVQAVTGNNWLVIGKTDSTWIGILTTVLNAIVFFFQLCAIYFASCTPLPPGMSKLKMLGNRLRKKGVVSTV